MNSVVDFLVIGLGLQLPPDLEKYIEPVDSVCCITGAPISRGIPWKRVIPGSTGEYLDLMHGMTFSHMSLAAAAAFKGSQNLGSRLIFEDGTHYHPCIAAESANDERPCWSKVVREVWPARAGQRVLCIIASDYKKRVWPRATLGLLGENTPVFLLDQERFVMQNLLINWEWLLAVLNLVENVYGHGFSKQAIQHGLYLDYQAFVSAPLAQRWERALAGLRSTAEFKVSILIAQKGEGIGESKFWPAADGTGADQPSRPDHGK